MGGKVVVNRAMSLDGFIAGPGDAMDWIFDFVTPDAAWLKEIAAATGAMLVGRRTDEVGDRMDANRERGSASSDESYPFSGPTFVLTHRPPDPPAPGVTYLSGDIGAAVATRRNDHLFLAAVGDSFTGRPRLLIESLIRLVVISVGVFLTYYGYINFLRGFSSFRMPSMTPIASLYAAIPISGALITLFAVEQLVNGWRNGFEGTAEDDEPPPEGVPPP